MQNTNPKKLDGPFLAPRNGGKARQLVVILHGYGDSGAGILGLAHEWAEGLPDAAFVAPNAIDVCDGWPSGFQWFALRANQPVEPGAYSRAELIRPAADALNAYIDAQLAHWGLDDSALVVAGFSQGAMMALYTMPRRKKPCAAVVAYSGMSVDGEGLKAPGIVKPPVLAVHGALDDVVPPSCLEGIEADFSAAGFEIETIMRSHLAHSIDAFGLSRGLNFIQENLEKSIK